jgi:hypothetical protein
MLHKARIVAASLVLFAGSVSACKRDGQQTDGPTTAGGGRTVKDPEPPRPRSMPKPLPLPSSPAFAAHVAVPGEAIVALAEATGLGSEPRTVLATLSRELPPEYRGFAEVVDMTRPWSVALLDGEVVIRVAVLRDQLLAARRMVSGRPPIGDYGAVQLSPPSEVQYNPPLPRLAWLDDGSATLTLAGSERGLATGRELAGAYGKHDVFLTVDGAELRNTIPELPFTRIRVEGKHPGDFKVTAQTEGPIGSQIEGMDELADGALSGLLASPELIAGASTRYAKHEAAVKSLITEATRTVEGQNFLVRGVLEDMLKRYKAVLRSWNGRVMGGVGSGHVLLALGSDDPKKGAGAVTSLIDSVLGNLELARTLGLSVPKMRLKRNAATTEGVSIHVIMIDGARKMLPASLAGLVDDKGTLRVAFGGSQHAGAVVAAVGPNPALALSKLLSSTKDAPAGAKTTGDLLAVSYAIDLTKVPGLAQGQPDMNAILKLVPSREATRIVGKRKDDTLDIDFTGPRPVVKDRAPRPPTPSPSAAQRTPPGPQRVPPRAPARR